LRAAAIFILRDPMQHLILRWRVAVEELPEVAIAQRLNLQILQSKVVFPRND
jgi:hypothetical protein